MPDDVENMRSNYPHPKNVGKKSEKLPVFYCGGNQLYIYSEIRKVIPAPYFIIGFQSEIRRVMR